MLINVLSLAISDVVAQYYQVGFEYYKRVPLTLSYRAG